MRGSSLMGNPRWGEQMDLKKRPVDPLKDKEMLLEFHCMANYESDNRTRLGPERLLMRPIAKNG